MARRMPTEPRSQTLRWTTAHFSIPISKPLASIPLNDGAGGTVVPFDSAFVQKYHQSVYGGDVDAYLAPFFVTNHE